MGIDFSELDVAFFWNQAFAAADANWRRLPTSERANHIIALLRERGAKRVLDLGCAIGRLSMLIAAQGIEVYGLDASEKAIDFARAWARDEQMPDIHFDVGMASTLPYPDATFDAAVANAVLDHMPLSEAQKAVREMLSVLRPGGLIFASFDGLEGKETAAYHTLADRTRLYTHGMHRGLVWRYYPDDEIRPLFAPFRVESMQTDADGSRIVVAVKAKPA
jgi:2-polyprenyl-3-methyl-5-hydroxy-6-metoxy-1,4-benzoquinol methylase